MMAGRARVLLLLCLWGAVASAPLFAMPAAAQESCAIEQEPNDTPELATPIAGAFCLDGSMSTADQEILAWTLDAETAKHPFTLHIDGPLGVQSKLQIYHLDEPGDADNPAVVGPELFTLATTATNNLAERANVFLAAGTYLVGLSSSSDAAGPYHVAATMDDAPPDTPAVNVTADAATPVAAGFDANGVLGQREVWYNWTLSAADTRRQWTLTATAPLGAQIGLDLQTPDGKPLLAATRLNEGRLVLPDIGLPAGTYRIRLAADADGPFPYALNAASEGPRSAGREDEPNDTALTARPLALGQAMVGHISQSGDVDTFLLPLTDVAGKLFDIELGGESKVSKRVCVGSAAGDFLMCRDGEAPVLSGVAISDKTRFVTVSGGENPGQSYSLTVRASSAATPDAEAEPNDTAQTANPLAVATMHGRFAGSDTDMFAFTVADTNLRHFTLTGDGATVLDIVDSQAQSSARVERDHDASGQPVPGPLDIDGLALPPGSYFAVVSGTGGEYQLVTDSAAAPTVSDSTAEIEPNDTVDHAQPLFEGKAITGQLEPGTQDMFRMSLATAQRLAIHITPDEACGLSAKVDWQSNLGQNPALDAEAGKPAEYRGLFQAEDYYITLRPGFDCTGTARYSLGYDGAPDVPDTGDVEPDDTFALARPMPPSLEVSGTVGQYSDDDWLRLPPVATDSKVTITVSGDVSVSLTDGTPTSSAMLGQPAELASGNNSAPATATMPAGQAGAVHISGSGAYTVKAEIEGIAPAPATEASASPLDMKLTLDATTVAAYWHRGQRLTGTLSLSNAGSAAVEAALSGTTGQPGWTMTLPDTVTVAPGESQSVPLTIEIAPDPYAQRAVRITAGAASGGMPVGSATADIAVDPAAMPTGDHLAFTLPDTLLGGFDIASTALGATLQTTDKVSNDDGAETINDGLGSNAGFRPDAGKLPVDVTIGFTGDHAWPVRGMTINPQTPGLWPSEYLSDFELWLSPDGTSFEKALTGRVSAEPREQAFVLPAPVMARAARLRMLSNANGNTGHVGFSEWKVITDPSAELGTELDVADTARGGHIVWSQPLISEATGTLRGIMEAGGDGPIVAAQAGVQPQFILGFNEDRAAKITRLEWADSPVREDASLFSSVVIEASTETPLGPWTPLGTWTLDRDAQGRASKTLDAPAWARFLRLSWPGPLSADTRLQFPTELHVYEQATGADYRSVLGEWGEYSPDGYYELTQPQPAPPVAESGDHQTRDTAGDLDFAQTVSGRVELDHRQDWYRLVQPADRDLLDVTLGGEPTVGADVTLWDEAGKALPLNENGSSSPREAHFEARVEPGKTYYLQVTQPPHSVVIAYDTSGSLLQFIPMIHDALGVFAGGVLPGQESVNFLPFDSPPMLKEFTDQPRILQQALAKDDMASTTSGLEYTAMEAMRQLGSRRGTRALLLITDAATSESAARTDMWSMIDQTRPRIFAAHTGSFDDPLQEKQVLEDLALANGGRYVSTRSQAELDVAFDRLAAYLRRPASYALSIEANSATPPEPGLLEIKPSESSNAPNIITGDTPPSTGQAVEIVLDASGSMLAHLGSERKIEIARAALDKLLSDELKPNDPVALRVFGNDAPGSCATSLAQPLGPLNPSVMRPMVDAIVPQNLARTPIAASLAEIPNDLAGVTGQKVVVLITDGEETCGGDPRAAITALADADIAVRLNIVGFNVDDDVLKAEFNEWARIGRGRYFDVKKPEELDQAVAAATQVPFTVQDATGAVVAEGQVGDPPVSLPAGSYRVEIGQTPPRIIEGVVVKEKQTTRIEATTP